MAALADEVEVSPEAPRRARRRSLVRANPGVFFAGVILVLVLFCVAVPNLVAPGDPNALDLTARLLGPGAPNHILGTDPIGRDVWRLIVDGARLSVLIALAAVAFSCTIGVVLGLVSGYFGGWIETIIMRWTDVQLSF